MARTFAGSYTDTQILNNPGTDGPAAAAAKPIAAPVLNTGEGAAQAWGVLFDRAGVQAESDTTDDCDLHLMIDGKRLDAITHEDCLYTFELPAPPTGTLRLCSRSGVPSLLGITPHDHRRLGAAIIRIKLEAAGISTVLDHDAPLFVEGGCHPPEPHYSWTDGDFELPARLFLHLTGVLTITVRTERPGMRYSVAPAAAVAA